MKTHVLIVLISLSTMDLFAQITKGKMIISVDGNYTKTTSEDGATTNQNTAQIKNLSLGASVGYFITDKFMAGIGLDYYSSKEYRTIEMMVNRFFQVEFMNIKSKAYLPNIYVGNYYQITNKLYINTNLKFSYGNIKSEYNTVIVGSVIYPTDTIIMLTDRYSSTYSGSSEMNSELDFFNAKLFPELNYFISSNFSLCLGLGGIEYSMIDWKTDNSNWIINFNPVNWKFGIKMKL